MNRTSDVRKVFWQNIQKTLRMLKAPGLTTMSLKVCAYKMIKSSEKSTKNNLNNSTSNVF